MDQFSVFNYNNLSDELKASFNIALIQKLSSLMKEIKADDTLGFNEVDKFVTSLDNGSKPSSLVADLYSKVSAGIQAGSGNQNLFHAVLCLFTESWEQIKKS